VTAAEPVVSRLSTADAGFNHFEKRAGVKWNRTRTAAAIQHEEGVDDAIP
jgi:hypothetical protein